MSDTTVNPAPNPTSQPASSAQPGLWARQSAKVKSVVVATAGIAATAVGLVAPSMGGGQGTLEVINGCGKEGAAQSGQWQYNANPLKNRWDFPSGESLNAGATIENLLQATSVPPNKETRVPDPDKVTNGFDQCQIPNGPLLSEGDSAEITGYIVDVKVGGNESCNCGTNDEPFMDTHIYVGPTPDTKLKSQCVIVEVTPRMRTQKAAAGVDWSTPTLISTLKPGTQVQISGWLFDDQEHRPNSAIDNPGFKPGANVWRGTCWEIHPVTDIQVLAPAPSKK